MTTDGNKDNFVLSEQGELGNTILNLLLTLTEEVKAMRGELDQLSQLFNKVENIPEFETPSNATNSPSVKEWLYQRWITVEDYRHPSPVDKYLDDLAILLGCNYKRFATLHTQLRRRYLHQSFERIVTLDAQQVELAKEYLEQLKNYGFVTVARDREGKAYISPQNVESAVRFFSNGTWFERFIQTELSNLLEAGGYNFDSLTNVKIRLPDGRQAELDLFYLVEGQPFWIECKSGDMGNEDLARYLDLRQIFGLSYEEAALIFLDKEDEVLEAQTILHNFIFLNPIKFIEKINYLWPTPFDLDHHKKAVNRANPPLSSPEQIRSILIDKQLDPLPQARTNLMKAVVNLFRQAREPLTLNQIKSALAKEVKGVKQTRIQHFLNVLLYTYTFLDVDGIPAQTSKTTKIARLNEYNLYNLETTLVEQYAKAILAYDTDFFNSTANRSIFQLAVEPKMVSAELQHLLDQVAAQATTFNTEEAESLDETPEELESETTPPTDPHWRLESVSSATTQPLPTGWKVVKDSFPAPKIRQEIISSLVAYIKSADYIPKLLTELKGIIADELNLSRNQVQSTIVNLFQAQCFSNENGELVLHHNELIFDLAHTDTEELEYKCVVNFLNRLYNAIPQAFTNPALIEATLGIKLDRLPISSPQINYPLG